MVENSISDAASALDDEHKIVDRVYSAVMQHTLAPNTKLSESTICESFGVGRMKARRALLLLASQGIVDLRSNRGAFIACPDQRDADEVFEARIHIEPSLVGQVADRIDRAGLKALGDHVKMEKAARRADNRQDIIRLSGEFHVLIATVSGNKFLTRTLRELVTRTSLIVALFGSGESSCCRDDEHEKILEAIKSRNAGQASELTREHLEHIRLGLDFSQTHNSEPDLISLLRAN
ncbi:GntR family transcriptional regulator [uncultured Roseovarius sp.]|uniref:GntR family transcriptional regulator n=1 Tax=uncultured Roseovarius sp. TaxID=293344 RepID=UPI002637C99B|nr:GntR family transcriptional regulator [uncultured Roseovarius sp.]